MKLQKEWNLRKAAMYRACLLREMGSDRLTRAERMRQRADALWARANKTTALGTQNLALSKEIEAEARKAWALAILKKHGNVPVTWEFVDGIQTCSVEGERYE